jgi:hypothetical protein
MAFSNVLTLAGSTLTGGIRIKKADGEDLFPHEDRQLTLVSTGIQASEPVRLSGKP